MQDTHTDKQQMLLEVHKTTFKLHGNEKSCRVYGGYFTHISIPAKTLVGLNVELGYEYKIRIFLLA